MYIFPEKETTTGSHKIPIYGSLLSIGMVVLYTVFIIPSGQALEKSRHGKLLKLKELINKERQVGNITYDLAEGILDDPSLIEDEEIKRVLSFNLRSAYKEYTKKVVMTQVSTSNFNIKDAVNGLFSLDIFLFFSCLLFFFLAAFYIEHILSPFIYLVTVIFVFLCLMAIHIEIRWTWSMPLNNIFPALTLSLWLFILRMSYKSQLVIGFGIFKIWNSRISLSTVFVCLFFLVTMGVEHFLLNPFVSIKTTLLIVLIVAFFLSLLPFITGNSLNNEARAEWRVVGRTLNLIDGSIKSGDHEEAKKMIIDLNTPSLTSEQSERLAELAWNTGLNDVVKTCYQRQLLKFEGDESSKEALLKKMLLRDVKIPSSQYEIMMKKALNVNDTNMLRTVFPLLGGQTEKTQEHIKVTLRERIKKAIKEEDIVFLNDILPKLKGLTVFGGLVAGIHKYLNDRTDDEIYIDNYARAEEVSKLVKIKLLDIRANDISMELSNSSNQAVPWMAVRGILGVFINTSLCGLLIVEFKKKLFVCQFMEGDMSGNLSGMKFIDVWKKMMEHAPEGMPISALKEFETISEDNLIQVSNDFMALNEESN